MSLFRRVFGGLVTVAALTGLAGAAQAGIMGVSIIEIASNAAATNGTTPGTLQVAELIATEAGTGNDLALTSAGATAVGSAFSNGAGTSSPNFAIDGINIQAYPDIFHSATNSFSETLRVTLAAPSTIESITIYGRSPGNGRYELRDIYDVTLFDVSGARLWSYTGADARTDGSVTFSVPAPTPIALLVLGLALIGYRTKRR